MISHDVVVLERLGPVVVIELNRPDAANSLNLALASELVRAAQVCDADAEVRAVVLTARGRFFCGGGDLEEMAGQGPQRGWYVKRLADEAHRAVSTFARMRAPVVVAVNGTAAGGGLAIAACGDLVLSAESATYTMAYSKVGLSPDGSSTYFLPRLIGLRRTQELAFTNRVLTAQEALAWGLVTRVVPDGQLREEAMTLANKLAQGPRQSHAAIKSLLVESLGRDLEGQMEVEGRTIAACAASADGAEGIDAFLGKRRPDFR
ncbi:MAG: enoyl-CoA hydratase-related protein [Pseudomonadota bacterium]